MSLREQRRRHQDQLSIAHILDAAEEVFAVKGYVGATIREIADQAEFSVGALYNLFSGGKEEIFTAVISRRTEEYMEILGQTLSDNSTPYHRLHAIVDKTLSFYREQVKYYQLFQRAIGGDWLKFEATASDRNWQHYQTILDHYAGLFSEGIEAGEFRDDDPAAMAVLLAGLQQAYLAHAVVGLGPHGTLISDAYPPERLHELIDRAFART